jgi:hypothetical protein
LGHLLQTGLESFLGRVSNCNFPSCFYLFFLLALMLLFTAMVNARNTTPAIDFFTGSGEPEACEARVDMFVRSVGFAGLIAIACAVFALGVMGTLVMQACYTRLTSKDKWHEQEGHKV